jgi:hypothetical protein
MKLTKGGFPKDHKVVEMAALRLCKAQNTMQENESA